MVLFVLAASFPIIFVPVVELFPDPSCIFLILKSGQFPSRIVVVQNKCIVFGISPSVPYPFVELFSSAPPIINCLTTAQGLNLTKFTCLFP